MGRIIAVIHTIDIMAPITSYQLQEFLREQGVSSTLTRWSTRDYGNTGLTRIAVFLVEKNNYPRWYLHISMNPQHVLTSSPDPMALFDMADFAELIPAFDSCLANITSIHLPSLPCWVARRIDYAEDAVVGNGPSRPCAGGYITLAERGLLPIRAEDAAEPHWISYRASNKSGNVVVYHRGPALRAKFRGLSDDVYAQADRLLRLEIQCHKGRLASLARRYHFPDRQLQHFLTRPDIGQMELQRQALRIFGRFAFQTYKRSAGQIDRAKKMYGSTRENLKHFLKAVNAAPGISEAQSLWTKGARVKIRFGRSRHAVLFTSLEVRRLRRRLRDLQINLVSVPPEWHRSIVEQPFQNLFGGAHAEADTERSY